MKKIIFILLLSCCYIAKAQNFEGILTWKFTAEMDAATKAKMDAAQQKMNDPATQAQMKEMKEKMNDPEFKKEPGQFRAELHDRIMAPIYPLAFMIIAYAYLGAPRTTRQSRSMSLISTIAGVAALRLIGFASMVFGINSPFAVYFQYVAVIAATALGTVAISRGVIIEPPAFITNFIARITERLSRRLATT